MNVKLRAHLDQVFAPYSDLKPIMELKEELLRDSQERYDELKATGHKDAVALQMTIDSIGEVSELVEGIGESTRQVRQIVGMNLSSSNLPNPDLQGVTVHDGKFNYANLKGSDFSEADLTNSSFQRNNLEGVKFDRANLSGARIIAANLEGATFQGSILDGTDFSYSNLSNLCFDNHTLNGTIFDRSAIRGTTFRNAVLFNVSFKTEVKKAVFDGATMDKLTFAMLKGAGAKVEKVSVH